MCPLYPFLSYGTDYVTMSKIKRHNKYEKNRKNDGGLQFYGTY